MARRIRSRKLLGRRERPIFGVLRLRPPIAYHTEAEGELIRRYAAGAKCAVEIGVAEGGSAWEIRQALAPDGTLFLVDPYPPGLLFGINMTQVVAKRVVGQVGHGNVRWIREYSNQAVQNWTRPIDFLFIDGDHRLERVARDWADWTPHVRRGGIVAMHDAFVSDGGRVSPDSGPATVVRSAVNDSSVWDLVDGIDATAILKRSK